MPIGTVLRPVGMGQLKQEAIMQKASPGRIVLYRLNSVDAEAINKRRSDAEAYHRAHSTLDPGEPGATGHQAHVGNYVVPGDLYPAVVVRVFNPSAKYVNLQVLLDGSDTYWATSRTEGDGEGCWSWPPRV